MNNTEEEFVVDEQVFKDIIKWFKDENDKSIFEIHYIKSDKHKYDFYIAKKSIAYISVFDRIN